MKEQPKRGSTLSRRAFHAASMTTLGVAGALGSGEASAQEREKTEEIPVLKYDLEAQTHWTGAGGSAKEATVAEFPVSQSMAGVSMRLDPGAIRELHWHALAAEWAYMLEGRCRVTVISPNGQSEVSEFGPGDTWYFPRGHGHALQGLGPGQAHFLLVFDNGHFSEFGTFSWRIWRNCRRRNFILGLARCRRKRSRIFGIATCSRRSLRTSTGSIWRRQECSRAGPSISCPCANSRFRPR
jgi:oxalate decarboxylase